MDLISVVIPIYNVEKYLDRCIQSVVNQTYTNLEIILVDDGSPDGCGAMCDAWAERDCRIKVIHKKNGGLSDARNAGMAVAKGEYIAFVDSDDWIARDYIEAMILAAAQTGAQIVACDVLPVYEEKPDNNLAARATDYRICGPEEALGDLICGRGFRAVAWNKLYHRSLWRDITFPVGVHHEDEYVTYRVLARAEKLVYIDTPMYFYFQRQGSIMHSVSPKRLDALKAYWERLTFLEDRFPKLYVQDKVSFCIACAGFYQMALSVEKADVDQFKEEVCRFRRRVRFSGKEMRQLTLKQIVYVWGTGCCMNWFCRILQLREG